MGGCREDFTFESDTGNLLFSLDTVFLDTTFTNVNTTTKILKVYNPQSKDISIPSIWLDKEDQSNFRINVNGASGLSFTNVPLRAKDSLFVFIESSYRTDSDNTAEDFLIIDELRFGTTINFQKVNLVSLVQNANFYYPPRDNLGKPQQIEIGTLEDGTTLTAQGFNLDDSQLNWNNELPHVVYGYAVVTAGRVLRINAGSKVHFHANSGIIVKAGGQIEVMGMPEDPETPRDDEVIFEGDRISAAYKTLPGQWGLIWIQRGSINNSITHATIKNGTIGLLVEGLLEGQETISLKQVSIYNHQNRSLLAIESNLLAVNSVFGNALGPSVELVNHGIYNFYQCTIANFWNLSPRRGAALQFTYLNGIGANNPINQTKVQNSIIEGNKSVELAFESDTPTLFNFTFNNNGLKVNSNNLAADQLLYFDFNDPNRFINNHLNLNSEFINSNQNDFRLFFDSPFTGKLDPSLNPYTTIDRLGNQRTLNLSLGAFENTLTRE